LEFFVAKNLGLFLQIKVWAMALHFRQTPELDASCDPLTRGLVVGVGDELSVLQGLMVREIKVRGPSKGDAVRILMGLPPFAGRRPVYAGDDAAAAGADTRDRLTRRWGWGGLA
jgi:trehalose 6-phosphate phosphatase